MIFFSFEGLQYCANIVKTILRYLGKKAVFYYTKCLPYSAFESTATFKKYTCVAEVLMTTGISICFILTSLKVR